MSIIPLIIVFAVGLYIYDKYRKPRKTKEIMTEIRMSDVWIARDKMRDRLEDDRLNRKYKTEISKEALRRYDFWLLSNDWFYNPHQSGIHYISSNHKEVFGDKSFDDMANEELKRIKDKYHTPEEQELLNEDRKRRILGPMYEVLKERKENKL